MKKSPLIVLIALLLIGCGSSTTQAVVTATPLQVETPTAAPLPTSTPTELPAPSPEPTRELEVIEVAGLSLDTLYLSEELGISFQHPSAWDVIKASDMGGKANEIVVMEDYDKVMEDFANFTFSTMDFRIFVLDEAAPANEAINLALCNTEAEEPTTRMEVINGQDFFWLECKGQVHVDGKPLLRFFTGISNGDTSAVASTMINSSSAEAIRPIYEAIVRTIILP